MGNVKLHERDIKKNNKSKAGFTYMIGVGHDFEKFHSSNTNIGIGFNFIGTGLKSNNLVKRKFPINTEYLSKISNSIELNKELLQQFFGKLNAGITYDNISNFSNSIQIPNSLELQAGVKVSDIKAFMLQFYLKHNFDKFQIYAGVGPSLIYNASINYNALITSGDSVISSIAFESKLKGNKIGLGLSVGSAFQVSQNSHLFVEFNYIKAKASNDEISFNSKDHRQSLTINKVDINLKTLLLGYRYYID